MLKRVHFDRKVLPFLLVAPQIVVTLVFFIWPAAQALYQSVLREDPFGLKTSFIWFENFARLFEDDFYLAALERTAFFSISVTLLAMSSALLLAVMANRVIQAAGGPPNVITTVIEGKLSVVDLTVAPVKAPMFFKRVNPLVPRTNN